MALVGSAAGRRLRASRQCAALLPPPAAAPLPPVLTSRPTCLPALPCSWSSRNGWWRALCGAPLSPRRSWMRCQRMWAPTAPSARRECRPLLCSSVQWGVCLLPLAVVVCAGCVLVADPIAGSSAGSPLSRPLSFPTLPPSLPPPLPPLPPLPALPCPALPCPAATSCSPRPASWGTWRRRSRPRMPSSKRCRPAGRRWPRARRACGRS
jgi:hypothetical protein